MSHNKLISYVPEIPLDEIKLLLMPDNDLEIIQT
jgi:hypothetical protein